jgi:hypothetical protein
VTAVADIFASAPFRWRLAGGHALELFTGRSWRSHGDIDLLILRPCAREMRQWLADWDVWAADPPGQLRPWRLGEPLPSGVHDIWRRRHARDDWRFQIMVDEGDDEEWRSRRDERIRLPVKALGSIHPAGVPYLRPEVQLYGKAKQPRPKDIEDLHQTLPELDAAARNWLAQSIRQTFGGHHPWLAHVEAPAS